MQRNFSPSGHRGSVLEVLSAFLKLGLTSFGGRTSAERQVVHTACRATRKLPACHLLMIC
jgi:hypothetical protein